MTTQKPTDSTNSANSSNRPSPPSAPSTGFQPRPTEHAEGDEGPAGTLTNPAARTPGKYAAMPRRRRCTRCAGPHGHGLDERTDTGYRTHIRIATRKCVPGSRRRPMQARIHHVNVPAHDVRLVARFYSEVLGLTEV